MKKKVKNIKCLIALLMAVITVVITALPVSATWTYPDGGTLTADLINESGLNKTIYVYHKDSSGNLLKYCVYKTKITDYDVFGDSLYGYDIVKYSSNEGLGEHCKMTWACGNGETAGYGQIGYQFYWISQSSLKIYFTYEKQEATTFNISHYTLDESGKNKTLYASSSESHQYGDSYNIKSKTITGYELVPGYESTLSGTFTYDVVASNSNFGNLSYDYHAGSKRGEMYDWNSYTKSDKNYIDYCDTRELTVKFMYQLKSYTVTFNANGGSGAPENLTKRYGITVTIPETEPTRTGYTFEGWGTYSTDTTANYLPGDNYTANSGRTLYAIWKSTAPTTYTVSYNSNGGSGAPASQTKTKDVTLTLSSVKPTKTGYTFLGWSTNSSATTATYVSGGSYTANSGATLYAVWKKDATPVTYSVSYYANGGTGAPATQTKTQNVALTLSKDIPKKSGFNFIGWGKSSSDTVASYQPGSSYTANASITLTALWEKIPPETYTISYDANGGDGAPAAQTKTEDVDITVPYTEPSRNGYLFLGWSRQKNASYATYNGGDTISANLSMTLYAVWQKVVVVPKTYTVSYQANGGENAPAEQTKTENITLTLTTDKPTKRNYDFLGWSTSSTATYPTYYAGGSYTKNADITLYAVWSYNPAKYTVSYDANGGDGAPTSQTKTNDIDLTLSSSTPNKAHSTFLGWSTSSNATAATYQPGDSYTDNAAVTLYAVWRKDNYEFSVSGLTVSESEVSRYGIITVKFRTDSWDKNLSYSDIPVELLYDGTVIATKSVSFAAYGVANLTFDVNVGGVSGNHTLTARINWSDRANETNPNNNSVSTTVTVKEYEYDFSMNPVTVTDDYYAGTTVISSFTVSNNGSLDVLPSDNHSVSFTAYYYNGSSKVIVSSQTWSNVVIPANGTNLVYFKWSIPSALAGKTVYCECCANSTSALNEPDRTNNISTVTKVIQSFTESQTPNTGYEASAPSGYTTVSAPTATTGSKTWNMWVYENGVLVLKTYGIRVTTTNPTVTPSSACSTAVYSGGKWTMKSGYGITLSWSPILTSLSGYTMPGNNAYTSVQYVYAKFPEYRYLTAVGQFRILENVSGVYRFVANADADNSERVHFIPVYVGDGSYTVSVTATQIWTPAGMITATRNANTVTIDGTIYDDFYQG